MNSSNFTQKDVTTAATRLAAAGAESMDYSHEEGATAVAWRPFFGPLRIALTEVNGILGHIRPEARFAFARAVSAQIPKRRVYH